MARRDAELIGIRRELAQREVVLKGKEGQIARRDGEIETLTRELVLKGETLAEKDAELEQISEDFARVRERFETQRYLSRRQQTPGVVSSTEPPEGAGGSNADGEAELKTLRKANRKLKAQISGQWRTIATLRAVIRDAERRYDPLYPIEKAAVMLSAIFDKKLRGKPSVRPLLLSGFLQHSLADARSGTTSSVS